MFKLKAESWAVHNCRPDIWYSCLLGHMVGFNMRRMNRRMNHLYLGLWGSLQFACFQIGTINGSKLVCFTQFWEWCSFRIEIFRRVENAAQRYKLERTHMVPAFEAPVLWGLKLADLKLQIQPFQLPTYRFTGETILSFVIPTSFPKRNGPKMEPTNANCRRNEALKQST